MNSRIKLLRSLALIIVITGLSSAGFGHPLGSHGIDHDSQLVITPEKITIFYDLSFGELPAVEELKRINANGSGKLDDGKLAAYAESKARELAAGLYLSVNGQRLDLKPVNSTAAVQAGPGGLTPLMLFSTMETGPGALAGALVNAGSQALSFHDDNENERVGWRLVGIIGSAVDVLDESVNEHPTKPDARGYSVDISGDKTNVRQLDLHFVFRPFGASSPSPATVMPIVRRQTDPFTSLMSAEQLTPGKILLFLLFAAGLGGMHALSPGHGKTLVAAYLVGAQGTVRHALILGLAVTITHTAGVFALGLVALFASKYFLPDTIYPWLTAVSGLIIAQVGLWRLFNIGGTRHMHESSHEHEQVYTHSHGGFAHSHLPQVGEPITLRSLLTLGISGGALPCPSALVVLLSAVALHRVVFGLFLILSFSVGLAAVLTTVGIAVLHAQRHLSRSNLIPAWAFRLASKIGGLVIAFVGLFLASPAIRLLINKYG